MDRPKARGERTPPPLHTLPASLNFTRQQQHMRLGGFTLGIFTTHDANAMSIRANSAYCAPVSANGPGSLGTVWN